jgi:hypothetical protein
VVPELRRDDAAQLSGLQRERGVVELRHICPGEEIERPRLRGAAVAEYCSARLASLRPLRFLSTDSMVPWLSPSPRHPPPGGRG